MRIMNRFAVIVLMGTLSVNANAAGIFNVAPIPAKQMNFNSTQIQQIAPAQQLPQQPATTYQPIMPPAASVIQPINADPKVMAQFDRFANESDEAYIARMRVVYQRSVYDMEKASRDNLEKMKALAPK